MLSLADRLLAAWRQTRVQFSHLSLSKTRNNRCAVKRWHHLVNDFLPPCMCVMIKKLHVNVLFQQTNTVDNTDVKLVYSIVYLSEAAVADCEWIICWWNFWYRTSEPWPHPCGLIPIQLCVHALDGQASTLHGVRLIAGKHYIQFIQSL